MLVVGLTGGIASGKTTVSTLFAEQGIKIIDADVIGRQMLDPEQPGFRKLVDRLGNTIVSDDGTIDRQQLRETVFSQPQLKQWLEQTLHPLIFEACQKAIFEGNSSDYAVLVVPLMFETNFHELADRICVIDCPRETQLHRLVNRDGISADLAEKMIDSQMDNASRLAHADEIIRNDGEPETLRSQVLNLHHGYLEMAAILAK